MTSVQSREEWWKMINDYLRISSRLSHLYLLINLHHGLKDSDRQILQNLKHFPTKTKIVFTKADKLQSNNPNNISSIYSSVIA